MCPNVCVQVCVYKRAHMCLNCFKYGVKYFAASNRRYLFLRFLLTTGSTAAGLQVLFPRMQMSLHL